MINIKEIRTAGEYAIDEWRKSRSHMENLYKVFNNLPLMIIVKNGTNDILECNKYALKHFNIKPDTQITDLDLHDFKKIIVSHVEIFYAPVN